MGHGATIQAHRAVAVVSLPRQPVLCTMLMKREGCRAVSGTAKCMQGLPEPVLEAFEDPWENLSLVGEPLWAAASRAGEGVPRTQPMPEKPSRGSAGPCLKLLPPHGCNRLPLPRCCANFADGRLPLRAARDPKQASPSFHEQRSAMEGGSEEARASLTDCWPRVSSSASRSVSQHE